MKRLIRFLFGPSETRYRPGFDVIDPTPPLVIRTEPTALKVLDYLDTAGFSILAQDPTDRDSFDDFRVTPLPLTAREKFILDADAAARRRESERLLKWAEANIEAGRRAKANGDELGMTKYGAKAQALISASRCIANPGRM